MSATCNCWGTFKSWNDLLVLGVAGLLLYVLTRRHSRHNQRRHSQG